MVELQIMNCGMIRVTRPRSFGGHQISLEGAIRLRPPPDPRRLEIEFLQEKGGMIDRSLGCNV